MSYTGIQQSPQARFPRCRCLPWQTVYKIGTDVVEAGVAKGTQRSNGFGCGMPASHTPQFIIVKALDAHTDTVETHAQPFSGIFGGDIIGIHFYCALARATHRYRIANARES